MSSLHERGGGLMRGGREDMTSARLWCPPCTSVVGDECVGQGGHDIRAVVVSS